MKECIKNKETKEIYVEHTLEPIYDKNSKILILGSFPSVKSRENKFYYGHPQNRFWKVLACVYNEKLPLTIKEKTEFLLRNNIALWDVIYSCYIIGSSDSSIKNVTPVNITQILDIANIEKVYTNGGLSTKLYKKYLLKIVGIKSISLPSTSSANTRYSLEKLEKIWTEKLK